MTNPMQSSDPTRPQCTARRRDGNRCTNPPMLGSTTCRMHGGAAPQVRRAARLRLLELVDPAITTMAKIMNNTEASEQARLRAAENILDRAGYPRQVQVDSDSAKDLLMVRLLELRSQALAERDQVVEQAREIVEGQVVDDEGGADGQFDASYAAQPDSDTPPEAAGGPESDEQTPPVPPDTPHCADAADDESGDQERRS